MKPEDMLVFIQLTDFVEKYGKSRHFAEHPEYCDHCRLLREAKKIIDRG